MKYKTYTSALYFGYATSPFTIAKRITIASLSHSPKKLIKSRGLLQPLDHMPYALLTHISEPGCVYAGLSNGDVWRSSDRGDTWEQLPFHLPGIRRQMILV